MNLKNLPIIFFLAGLVLTVSGVYFWQKNLPTTKLGESGKTLSATISIDDFKTPEDVPTLPGGKLLSQNKSKDILQITLESAKGTRELSDFYKSRLTYNGWKIYGNGVYRKDKRKLEINLTPESDNRTIVILNYTPKEGFTMFP